MSSSLPIDDVLADLLEALASHSSAVLVAPPGAGKTTRVPPAILEGGYGNDADRIVMLEPRRVAARAAARRIAQEREWKIGEEVGYRIRFERKESRKTRILVVTEGMLVAMLQQDPFLEGIKTLVFDEFHERNLDSDLALSMARKLQEEARPDLKLVVMSATIDPAPIAKFLGGAPIIESSGRLHPVEIRYRPKPKRARLEDAVVDATAEWFGSDRSIAGDLLVFLPGFGEIAAAKRAISQRWGDQSFEVIPLHGDLSPADQDRALKRGSQPRVVLSTNVAESSVTVEGVRTVIDSGLARVPRFDAAVGLDRLELGAISRASAQQRSGRAGRLGPGVAIRLWSELEERAMPAMEVAEIQRIDLSGPALQLLNWGETDLSQFPWFEAPHPEVLERGLLLLSRLGALEKGRVTSLGKEIAKLPLPPRLARLAISAAEFGYSKRLALTAALLSERDLLRSIGSVQDPRRPGIEADPTDSDVLKRVELLEAFEEERLPELEARKLHRGTARRILRTRDLIVRRLPTLSSSNVERDADEAVMRGLLSAYPDRLARQRGGSRRGILMGGRGVYLRPESGVQSSPLFLCIDLEAGRRGERAEAGVRQASAVEPDWLDSSRLSEETSLEFDLGREQVVEVRRRLFEDLMISESRAPARLGEKTARVLAEAASENLGSALSIEDPEFKSWCNRVAWLSEHRPDLELPSLEASTWIALLPQLCAGKRSFRELRRSQLLDFAQGSLSAEQRLALEREAPERIEVPSGSLLPIQYQPGSAPVLAVRIQEVFGWPKAPRLAGDRVPLLLHLLAPNHRPQQVTDDLASFWANTYSVVRKELRRRYPKHSWPENPLDAKPERRPRRRK